MKAHETPFSRRDEAPGITAAHEKANPRYPNKLLVGGVAVVLAGGVLLLWNLGYLPQPGRLWPVAVILVGLFFLYLAWPRGRSDRWIIPGMVLTLGGIVFLLMNTILSAQSLERIWPAFMLVTGVSLVPYGFRKRGSARIAIVIPGALHLLPRACVSSLQPPSHRGGIRRVRPAVVADDPGDPRNRPDRFIFQRAAAE